MNRDLEGIIDSIMYTALKAECETQVILQLLVTKNIVTREEVQATREVVEKNSESGKLLTPLMAKIAADSEYGEQFSNILLQCKLMAPEVLTEKDEEMLAEMLQREYENKENPEKEDEVDVQRHKIFHRLREPSGP